MTDHQDQSAVQRSLEPLTGAERVRAAGALLFVATEPVPVSSIAHQLSCTVPEA
jgi:hypothetical protein